jgi:hypothetical protein
MGLDMYLYRKIYIWSPDRRSRGWTIPKKYKEQMGNHCVSEIKCEVMYWRKASHIHKWFVQNVQDGVDNCANYNVTTRDLMALKNFCEKIFE